MARAKAGAKSKVRENAKAKVANRVAHVKAAAKTVRAKANARATQVAKSVRAAAQRAKAVVRRVERVVAAAAQPKWLQAGMNYVNLYFTVSNPKASVEFYEKALGLEKRNAMPGPDGNYMHVEMAWHGQAVMFGPADPRSPQKTPKELGGTPFNFYLYCEDVDALTARARAAGAKVLIEPSDQFWGDRMSQIVDPDGYYWTLATHVRDIDFSKMTPPEHADDRKDGEAGASGTGAGNGDTTNAE